MIKIVFSICFLAIFAVGHSAFAQHKQPTPLNLPETDIYLFSLALQDKSTTVSLIKNITQRHGYDNQPAFTANDKSIVFSRGDEFQTDVYEYVIDTQLITQLTRTSATEFSPTPSSDNQSITFVSNRNGGIWRASRGDMNNPTWVTAPTDNREPVGYFAFNDNEDIVYWSRYGFSISLTNMANKTHYFVAGNTPPATPQNVPKSDAFSFIHRQMNGQVWIKILDPNMRSVTPLITIPGNNLNYAWAPDNSIFTLQDNQLMRYAGKTHKEWEIVEDLSKFGITKSNRLAISHAGKYLAIVGNTEAKKESN